MAKYRFEFNVKETNHGSIVIESDIDDNDAAHDAAYNIYSSGNTNWGKTDVDIIPVDLEFDSEATNLDSEKIISAIVDTLLDKELGYIKQDDGTYEYEIHASYDDKMSSDTAIKILSNSQPQETFWEEIDNWYLDTECDLLCELKKKAEEILTADDGAFPEGLSINDDDFLEKYLNETVVFLVPEEHYLKQEFNVNIMLDTGDGNSDFTLNTVYPAWSGKKGAEINDKASIVWLAKQQGYSKAQLQKALNEGDMLNPKGFLESMRVELANTASCMQTLTFLVKMSFKELLELNKLMRLQDRNGTYYDATKKPDCGTIVLDKRVMVGLFDPWAGGGSVLELQLEKDVEIPISFIRSALPDGGDGYSVESVYGMCGSAWRRDIVKSINPPTELDTAV